MHLPDVFCWTKFGTEAGETTPAIIERKERERHLNGGVFLWGIGNSVRPSMRVLVDLTEHPEVIFSPMRSAPRKQDASPHAVCAWSAALGLDGTRYEIPRYSLVTSRMKNPGRTTRHFALVCRSAISLTPPFTSLELDPGQVRNILTGAEVGSSQVTSIVRYKRRRPAGRPYPVAFRATLAFPYLVELRSPVPIPGALRLDAIPCGVREGAVTELLALQGQERGSACSDC